MTPKEYQAIREGMGMSRTELAQALGVTYQTIQFRESGRVPIRTEAEEAIRSLAEPSKLLKDVAAFIASKIEKGSD